MWEEGIICLFIFIGGFCILPSNIQKQLVSKKYMFITIITGICLYIFSVYILKMYRRKTEQFDLMSTCGTTGVRCSEDTPYCLVTERELPTNDLDQTIVFNTYGRYVKMFPSATQGDGWTGLSSLEIFDATGTNILKDKAVSSPSHSSTSTPSQQGKLVGDNGGKIRYPPNIFHSNTNDRNIAAWEVDLGQVYMITKIRFIGRGDANDTLHIGLPGNADWQNQPRNIGVRFRIYKDPTDVPTTGRCVTKPTVMYPTGTNEDEKPILEPIILDGMNGGVALKVYRGIKTSPGTLLTSYGLTDEQATSAYIQMQTFNNRMKTIGWDIFGTFDKDSNTISVISGPMPILGQTIFSSSPVTVYKTYKPDENEVFLVSGSYTRDEARAKCSSYGATLATSQELTEAYGKGAGWCLNAWLSDESKYGYPKQAGTCGSDTIALNIVSNNVLVGTEHFAANCYGIKPQQGTQGVAPFHPSTGWNAPTYSNTDTKGTPEQIFPVKTGSKVTAVNGRRITIDNKTFSAGNNIKIKMNGYQSDRWLAQQNLLLQPIKKMIQLPGTFNKEEAIRMYKLYNISKEATFGKDIAGNIDLEKAPVSVEDDGSKKTLSIIMSCTMPVTVDPSTGNSMNVYTSTSQDRADKFRIPGPQNTTNVAANALSDTPAPQADMPNTNAVKPQYSINSINDQFDLTGENTYDSSQTDLADAYELAQNAAGVNTGTQQLPRDVGAGRTQTAEFMLLGDSTSFNNKASAQAACETLGGRLATYAEVSNEYTNMSPYLKRPQWNEYGWVSDSDTKLLVTQEKTLTLPAGQGTWTKNYGTAVQGGKTDLTNIGTAVESSSIGTAASICKAIKPSLIPNTKSTNSSDVVQQLTIKKKGRYVRIWTPMVPFTSTDSTGSCTDSNYTKAAWLKTVCVKTDTIDRIVLSQVIIKDKQGNNLGLGRGGYVKAVYDRESGTYQGDPASLVNGDETIRTLTGGAWVSKKYLACPRSTTASDFTKNGDGYSTYQSRNICQADLYWQIDLGTSLYIETITLIGVTGNSSKGLRVEIADYLRPMPYNNDLKNWAWNDKSAFNPPCPANMVDVICLDTVTKIPNMLCLPAASGVARCPGDCDPGSRWCETKNKCILNMYDVKSWQSMRAKQIDIKTMLKSDGSIDVNKYRAAKASADGQGYKDWVSFNTGSVMSSVFGGKGFKPELCYDGEVITTPNDLENVITGLVVAPFLPVVAALSDLGSSINDINASLRAGLAKSKSISDSFAKWQGITKAHFLPIRLTVEHEDTIKRGPASVLLQEMWDRYEATNPDKARDLDIIRNECPEQEGRFPIPCYMDISYLLDIEDTYGKSRKTGFTVDEIAVAIDTRRAKWKDYMIGIDIHAWKLPVPNLAGLKEQYRLAPPVQEAVFYFDSYVNKFRGKDNFLFNGMRENYITETNPNERGRSYFDEFTPSWNYYMFPMARHKDLRALRKLRMNDNMKYCPEKNGLPCPPEIQTIQNIEKGKNEIKCPDKYGYDCNTDFSSLLDQNQRYLDDNYYR